MAPVPELVTKTARESSGAPAMAHRMRSLSSMIFENSGVLK